MKQSIKWHEECLKNMLASLARDDDEVSRLQSYADRLRDDCNVLEIQIAEAKRRGMDGFDADRLLKRRAAT